MVLDLLRELLARPSVTPDDAGCQEIVAERLGRAGFACEKIDAGGVSNLWVTHGHGRPVVCLAGHTDVVPPGPREAWESEPFSPTERDGELVARGAADMKASVAASVVALERLAREPHAGTIALLLTSDEEGPGVHGTRHVLDVLVAQGIQIDAAIVGEPTSEDRFGDTMKIGRRGSAHVSIRARGKQGHTAYPHLADNAAHHLSRALSALLEIDWGQPHPAFPATTLQVTSLSAGTGANNVVPGVAELAANVRFGPEWSEATLRSRVQDALDREGFSGDFALEASAHPFVTERGPLLEALSASIREVTGVEPSAGTGGGTSDARFFAAHGIPVAEFGPLNVTIHAANERVAIDCLEPLAEVYRRVLARLLQA